MNFLDKAIAYINPVAGETRQRARLASRVLETVTNYGYSESGASKTKPIMRGMTDVSRDPQSDIGKNLVDLRQRSRSLYQNDLLARGTIERMRVFGIGTGLHMRSVPDYKTLDITKAAAREWSNMHEKRFEHWCDHECDAYGMLNFYAQQRLSWVNRATGGDVFALLPIYDDRVYVRLLEADYCVTPPGNTQNEYLVDGVEFARNERRNVIAYHFAKKHPLQPLGSLTQQDYVRVPLIGGASGRTNVAHLLDPERIGYFRGVPYLAPALETFRYLQEYSRAELGAALANAIMTGVIYTETPDVDPLGEGSPSTNKDEDETTGADGADENPVLGTGNIIRLHETERMQMLQSTRPSANFGPFTESMGRMLGSGLNMPVDVLFMKFDSSYSASRAHLNVFWKSVVLERDINVRRLCRPTHQEWLDMEVATGRLDAPGYFDDPQIRAAWSRNVWRGPSAPTLDQYKEAAAIEKLMTLLLTTRNRAALEMFGEEWDQIFEEYAEEEELLREAGITPIAAPPTIFTQGR